MKPAWRRTTVLPLVTLLALVAAQQFLEVPGGGRLARGLENALHGPWFALVTWVLQLMFVRVAKREASHRPCPWIFQPCSMSNRNG